jgi:hypothetical protein
MRNQSLEGEVKRGGVAPSPASPQLVTLPAVVRAFAQLIQAPTE